MRRHRLAGRVIVDGRQPVRGSTLIKLSEGMLVFDKRQPAQDEGAEVLIAPDAIAALEPHRNGCYVYAAGQKWDVGHSHTEIAQSIRTARVRR
jgi:hypothetical protein